MEVIKLEKSFGSCHFDIIHNYVKILIGISFPQEMGQKFEMKIAKAFLDLKKSVPLFVAFSSLSKDVFYDDIYIQSDRTELVLIWFTLK